VTESGLPRNASAEAKRAGRGKEKAPVLIWRFACFASIARRLSGLILRRYCALARALAIGFRFVGCFFTIAFRPSASPQVRRLPSRLSQ